MRNHLVPLGVTRVSAGVSTAVGGRATNGDEVGQFEITDHRSVEEMTAALAQHRLSGCSQGLGRPGPRSVSGRCWLLMGFDLGEGGPLC